MRMFYTIAFVTLSCVACFGQSSYKGLTPGQSTRADVERVLGQPQKKISPTLVEFSGGADATKIYVQFADESVAAEVLRIELNCEVGLGVKDERYGCRDLYDRLVREHYSFKNLDARITRERDAQYVMNEVLYHGSPFFVVSKFRQRQAQDETGRSWAQWQLGLYSKELYENAVPKSCTGNFAGVWETNRGRMTITRTAEMPKPGEIRVKGDYSNNGTISGTEDEKYLDGEWRDSTGRGTMLLEFNDPVNSIYRGRSFTGTWERTSGKGPKEGKWEGRCVESQGGNQ